MNILIVSTSKDPHASAVQWGLRQLGVRSVLWDWSHYPSSLRAALTLAPGGQAALRFEADGEVHAGTFDAIWYRRPGKPAAPANSHPDDRAIIEAESARFLEYALPFAAHAATRWINAPAQDQFAANKMRQLALAQQHGFRIPATHMGNGADAVRLFLAQHDGALAHKGFYPMNWSNEDGSRTTACTARIEARQLESTYAIEACPSIYQELIAKQVELRLTVMGERVLGAVIDSQKDGPTTDWRCEGGRGVDNLSAFAVAEPLRRQCVQLCAALGIDFGCIDLIVTPDQELVFLEVNPAGQFLFNETADPALPMLDAFCRHLAGLPDGEGPRLRMADFLLSDAGLATHASYAQERASALANRRKAA